MGEVGRGSPYESGILQDRNEAEDKSGHAES